MITLAPIRNRQRDHQRLKSFVVSLAAAGIQLICVALLLLFSSHSAIAAERVSVDQLLTSVAKTLVRVRDKGEDAELPPLKAVTLVLRTAVMEEADGKISLVVVDLGGSKSQETTQELKLELGPPQSADEFPVSAAPDLLADAIVEAARSAKRAQTRKPPLHLRKLTATLQFVVKAEGGGGINFTLLPVTVSLGGKITQDNTQSVVIEFGSR